MADHSYTFRSVWKPGAPADDVYQALERLADYPAWWPEIKEVRPLTSEEYAAVLMGQVLSDAENPSGALLRFAGTLDPVEAAALREALDVAAPAEDS